MKKVNVIDINSEHANENYRYRGTYLHGVLETEIGYDIFSFDREISFPLGATKVIIESTGRRATFFLWEGDSRRGQEYTGYLVYDNDADYDFCRNNFELKSQAI